MYLIQISWLQKTRGNTLIQRDFVSLSDGQIYVIINNKIGAHLNSNWLVLDIFWPMFDAF